MKRAAAALGAALLALAASTAQAASLDVSLSPARCEVQPLSYETAMRRVSDELESQGIRVESGARLPRLIVRVEHCDGGDAVLELLADDGATLATRTVRFDGVEYDAKPRVLALAAAELLRRSPVFVPRPPPPPPAPRQHQRPHHFVGLYGGISSVGSRALAGGEAQLSLRWRAFELAAAVKVHGDADEAAKVRIRRVLSSLAFAPRLVTAPTPRLEIAVGPSGELGIAWLSAAANAPLIGRAARVPVGVLGADAQIRVHAADHLWLSAGGRVGGAVLGYRAALGDVELSRFAGFVLGANVGAAWAF